MNSLRRSGPEDFRLGYTNQPSHNQSRRLLKGTKAPCLAKGVFGLVMHSWFMEHYMPEKLTESETIWNG